MGPMLFDYGYGPFRWVCLSGKHEDLIATDHAAMEAIDPTRRYQDRDNYNWIRDAERTNWWLVHKHVSSIKIVWANVNIALKFNELIRQGKIGPVMIRT